MPFRFESSLEALKNACQEIKDAAEIEVSTSKTWGLKRVVGLEKQPNSTTGPKSNEID